MGEEDRPAQPAATSDEDALLVSRIAAGDRAALGALVRRHQRAVLDLAMRTTGNRVLAEDIAQEAFLRVWRSAAGFEPRARFSTWLYRIVVNLCLDAFKKRQPTYGEPPERTAAAAMEPPAEIQQRERAAAVEHAVRSLPERQRVAVILHRYSELPLRAISEATGWSESSVESLLVRAYATLREQLRDLEKS